jgi:ElaB/YqjD/DUF883 family membrane-anchored ribosome-binding protein
VDHDLEVIRDQMEETRESLGHKLETLENQVLETVQTATTTVSSAVEGAQAVVSSVSEGAKQVVEKVSETVDTVKESLDVTRYVEQYPWVSVGAAVAVGFCAAQLIPSRRSTSGDVSEGLPPASNGYFHPEPSPASVPLERPGEPAHEEPSWTSALEGIWHRVAPTVEGLAVGALMSVIKDLVTSNVPKEWQGELTRLLDDVTGQMGGKVMEHSPLHDLLMGRQAQQSPPATEPSAMQNQGAGV